ncbi:MAG: DUF2029 domain-containing protein [Candidatus Omnitrophota bacterium]|nr:MAG: DUF2029 domain-containing protein [Candidatus Omnitrophota bacterium]
MIPLSRLHMHLSVPIWYLSIFIFFIISIFFITKILTLQDKTKTLSKTFYFLGILMSLRFLLSVIQRVQSDALVLFLLAGFIYALFLKKDILAGFSLAGAFAVKLTPLIFFPFLILRKKFKAAASFLLFVLFYGFSPALYLGFNKNLEYLKSFLLVHRQNPADYIMWYKNQSLLSCLLRFLTQPSQVSILNLNPQVVYIIFAILAAFLFSLIFISRKKTHRTSGFSYLADVSLVLICMIIFSPLAWKHTFVHLIIPHLVLLYYIFYLNPQDKITKVLVISSFLINTMLNPEITGSLSKIIQLYSNVTFGTLLLYAALLRARGKYADLNYHSHL